MYHTGIPASNTVASNAEANASIHNPAKPTYNFQSGAYAFLTELFELLLSPFIDVAGVDHAIEEAIVEVMVKKQRFSSNPVGKAAQKKEK